MALLPQNPRDQRLFIVALLAIGLAVVYQQLVWSPKNAELAQLTTRLDTLDSLNKIAQAEVAKGSATKMQQEADAFRRELAVLRRLVPTENEVPVLLESISTAARRAGLEVSDVQPDGVMNGDQYDTYKYKLGVIGPFHQVTEFFTNIASMSRIVAPINVTLAPSGRSSEIKARKNEQLLDVKFGIQTYVAHASVKAPDAPPAAAKPGAP
jgi:type IV pilus assembly protein PilO